MPISPDIPKAEAAIIEMTNAFRRGNALGTVASEPLLTKAAREYARFLAAAPIFSHEADGRRPVDRIKSAGYQPCRSAENLAWMLDSRGFETRDLANRMVEGWKDSPPHRENLMLAHVTETGVAIAKVKAEEKYISVQLFGRPVSLRYTFQIENNAGRAVAYKVAGQSLELKPNMLVQHTACEPGDVEFRIRDGGILAKAATARYEARDGQVYKLTRVKSGEISVEAGAKAR